MHALSTDIKSPFPLIISIRQLKLFAHAAMCTAANASCGGTRARHLMPDHGSLDITAVSVERMQEPRKRMNAAAARRCPCLVAAGASARPASVQRAFVVFAFTSAPDRSRRHTRSASPLWQASCSKVNPLCRGRRARHQHMQSLETGPPVMRLVPDLCMPAARSLQNGQGMQAGLCQEHTNKFARGEFASAECMNGMKVVKVMK